MAGPTAISLLGAVTLVASSAPADISLEDGAPTGGFKCRATMVQLVNEGYRAFLKAESNMDQIRRHTDEIDDNVR